MEMLMSSDEMVLEMYVAERIGLLFCSAESPVVPVRFTCPCEWLRTTSRARRNSPMLNPVLSQKKKGDIFFRDGVLVWSVLLLKSSCDASPVVRDGGSRFSTGARSGLFGNRRSIKITSSAARLPLTRKTVTSAPAVTTTLKPTLSLNSGTFGSGQHEGSSFSLRQNKENKAASGLRPRLLTNSVALDAKPDVAQKATTDFDAVERDAIIDDIDETWKQMRKRDLLKAAIDGKISKSQYVSTMVKKLKSPGAMNSKISVAAALSKEDTGDAALAAQMEAGWQMRGFGNKYSRTVEIWAFLISAELKLRKVKDPEEKSLKRMEYAEDLCRGLLRLGPTFIKLGQLLSTRRDVLTPEYIKALERLQDDVPGFTGSKAKAIIEEDFGKPIDEIFQSFDETPIAAASLGQVHKAVLKNGQEVAVKIQRQGLDNLFKSDLVNLRLLAVILDKLDPKTDGAQRDWVRIYEESARLLYKEIDYTNEAKNAERFKENFADVPWIKVPDIYWETTSKRVLTMEYVPSVKINNIEEIERRGIDRMDEFSTGVRKGLVNLIYSVYENDEVGLCNALEEMGILQPDSDRLSVERISRFFLEDFQKTLKASPEEEKWINQLSPEEKKKARAERISTVYDDREKKKIVFLFLSYSLRFLEGIGKTLDKGYDLTRLAVPYLKELLELREGSVVRAVVKQYAEKLGWRKEDINALVTQPRQVAYISNVIRKLEKGDLKLRTRTLESERAFERSAMVQQNQGKLIVASALLNSAMALSMFSTAPAVASQAAFGLAIFFALQFPLGALKVRSFDKKSKVYGF
eukprot:jgi/Bigna1/86002/estExt_fgenesh1_pg.C_70230